MIKKIIPRSIKERIRFILHQKKIREVKKIFDKSAKSQAWLDYNDFEIIKFKQNLNLNNLDIIAKYPSCLKSKITNFNDLIENDFEIIFKKIKLS